MDPKPKSPKRTPLMAALAILVAGAAAAQAKGLIVHEWGTFTTLFSSSGMPLTGMYVDATPLPDFVFGLPYFNRDGQGNLPPEEKLRNVTVKMETPVLYFYSPEPADVTVKVGFNGGTISQWYPQRESGEADPGGAYVDFGEKPYQGSIEWKARVLAPNDTTPFSSPAGQETGEWRAPRNTDANRLRGSHGEIEKFLFYRGIGAFTSAVALKFDAGRLVISNVSGEDIPYLQIYDRPGAQGAGMDATIWWQGPLAAHAQVIANKPDSPGSFSASGRAAMDSLRHEMVRAGLFDREAQALLDTWYNGYFLESGLKAFWILPRKQVDAILPLEIKPTPALLERVIIGRSEILTPEMEASLRQAGAPLEAYKKDRYYLAYLDLVNHWGHYHGEATGVSPLLPARSRGRAALLPPGFDWASPVLTGAGRPRDARGRALPAPVPTLR